MSEILQQAVYTPHNDTYTCSGHRHDYVTFEDKKGLGHFLDGGTDYSRRSFRGDKAEMKRLGIVDWCLYSRHSWATICKRLLWGTRGKKGNEPLRKRPIASFELDHLKAIIANIPAINPLHKAVVLYWIERKEGER
jgi:hypothetical protein